MISIVIIDFSVIIIFTGATLSCSSINISDIIIIIGSNFMVISSRVISSSINSIVISVFIISVITIRISSVCSCLSTIVIYYSHYPYLYRLSYMVTIYSPLDLWVSTGDLQVGLEARLTCVDRSIMSFRCHGLML